MKTGLHSEKLGPLRPDHFSVASLLVRHFSKLPVSTDHRNWQLYESLVRHQTNQRKHGSVPSGETTAHDLLTREPRCIHARLVTEHRIADCKVKRNRETHGYATAVRSKSGRATGAQSLSASWSETVKKSWSPLGSKTPIYERFCGFDSHKCDRIIGLLAEACGNRTQTFGS